MILFECIVPIKAEIDLLAADLDVPEPALGAVVRLRKSWHVRSLPVRVSRKVRRFCPLDGGRGGEFSDQISDQSVSEDQDSP